MNTEDYSKDTFIDYITARPVPNIGAEANRQQVERILVDVKRYAKEDVEVDAPIHYQIGEEWYHSCLDLVVKVRGRYYMVIKCAPGSLASREREVIAAARLLAAYQLPLAIASDGRTGIVWDAISGKQLGQGLDAIPSREQAERSFDPDQCPPLSEPRRLRQQIIFRSYDSMNLRSRLR